MRTTQIPKAALLAALIAIGGAGSTLAQTNGADTHHPANMSQPQSGMGGMMGQGQGAMPGGSGMMPGGMMGGNMMEHDMMGDMPMMGMRGPMMKIMFAIADTDGDGALSFEEVTAIHKRIFNAMDTNKDGKVTPEEMQEFWGQ
ncbi:EF-hand domain-containing protein [Rhizobium jaguaris]|uniref:EF-hand domain-containing protein n=1 Tax=Rhizobium jaguaris TaxID=1312183 RepID=UPI0039BF193D